VRLFVFPEGGFRLPESLGDIPQCEIRIRESGSFLREPEIVIREAEKDIPEAVIRIREGEKVIRESGNHLPESIKHIPLGRFCPSGSLASRPATDRAGARPPGKVLQLQHGGAPPSHGLTQVNVPRTGERKMLHVSTMEDVAWTKRSEKRSRACSTRTAS
jgi:hypothetical protein